jgi:diadenosine tetraphosphatase ApaH/serine/threonine PP2A family protein phosphatase
VITALLADVHGNLEALEACLQHAHARGAQRFAFLGDLVGYGASPGAVVDRVADYVGRGALAVAGNHDVAIQALPSHLHGEAREAAEWTRAALSGAQRAFLASLPLIVREAELTLVHATADAPGQWRYAYSAATARESMEAAGTAYTFCGHVHEPMLYFRTPSGRAAPFRPSSGSMVPVPAHRSWLAIVGSAGQPRDRNLAAAYALFDAGRRELTFFRVPYDVGAAAARIRAAGLPASLADRLERGV